MVIQNMGLITHLLSTADGSSENYSKEQLASYIQSAWGYDTPLLYGSEGAAQEAVDALNQRSISMKQAETLLMKELSSHLSRRLLLL